jgi:GNAT superfamily N-acetyltransferase
MHTVYRLTAVEYNRYRSHLKSLDEDSRYLRFGYHIKDTVIDIVCDRIEQNPLKHRIFVIENEHCEVVAAGHISLEDPVELAFSVVKEYQGQGMGSALMTRCIEWCQNRGIRTGCMVCLSRNTAIKHLAEKHGVLVQEGSESEATLTIPEPNVGSVFKEVTEDNIAMFDHLGKVQKNFARILTYPLRF